MFVFLYIIVIFSSFFEWKSKESEYTKQFVYSSSGNLYYEMNDERIYVKTIYNTDSELIELNIPDKETVIMYSSKENPQECIYFDMDNTIDQSILNPFLRMITPLFLLAVAFFLINNTLFSRIYFGYVLLFALGLGFSVWQLSNWSNYLDLKNNNNVVEAIIYSEIYTITSENNVYKPVSYYYVDNQKNIYADDSYISGSLEENLGEKLELYYDKEDPTKVSKKENSVDYFLLFFGLGLAIVTFPFVFLNKIMESRFNRAKRK